jgi:hypothetical protein
MLQSSSALKHFLKKLFAFGTTVKGSKKMTSLRGMTLPAKFSVFYAAVQYSYLKANYRIFVIGNFMPLAVQFPFG